MNEIFLKQTPYELNKTLSERIREIRKRRKISQEKLSRLSGVSLGSLKRFESSGEISLISFTKIAYALGIEQEMEDLFSDVPPESIEEVINGQH